jgi:peptidoglycan hydrolase-like protein with peptidoglycan-binding domain
LVDLVKEALQQFMNQSSPFLRTPSQTLSTALVVVNQWRSMPVRWLLLSLVGIGLASPAFAQSAGTAQNPTATNGVLQSSDQGDTVSQVQRRLTELGYYKGPVTGYFDLSTQAAVLQFQRANGLAADGVVGAETTNALNLGRAGQGQSVGATESTGSGSTASNSSDQSVTEVQRQLTQLGYYKGTINGVFDSQTQTAVMNFQRDRGLAVDGIVGSATTAALYQTPASSPTAPTASSTTSTTASGTAASYTPAANDGLLQLGDTGTEVSNLQTRLQALGYYDGPISGSFGSQTQTALIAFQQAQGLTPDGIAGPKVNAALAALPTQSTAQPTAQPAAATPTQTVTSPQFSGGPAQTLPAQAPVGQTPAVQTPTIQTPVQTPTVQVPSTPGSITAPPVQSAESLPDLSSNRQALNQSLDEGRFSVSELQKRLQLRGFNVNETNGVYDTETQNAIMQAQQKYGLSQNDLF